MFPSFLRSLIQPARPKYGSLYSGLKDAKNSYWAWRQEGRRQVDNMVIWKSIFYWAPHRRVGRGGALEAVPSRHGARQGGQTPAFPGGSAPWTPQKGALRPWLQRLFAFSRPNHLSRAKLFPRNPTFLKKPLVRGSFAAWGRTFSLKLNYF